MITLILALLLPPPPAPLTPHWKLGQEYLYRGSVKESAGAIQLLHQYQLELRIIVLSLQSNSAEIVCCTKLTRQGDSGNEQSPSIHLTRALIDGQGNIASCTAPTGIALTIDGPATWESGFLLPLSAQPIRPGLSWEAAESGRLPRRFTWQYGERDSSTSLINAEQRSSDWDRPRADSTAWRRLDKLTFEPKATLPIKVHRTIERRAPAHQQVTSRLITEYELVRQEILSGPMLDERQRDIQQIRTLQDDVARLTAQPLDKSTRDAWSRLALRINRYQSTSGSTPFREALTTLLSTVQAGIDNRLAVQQAGYNVPGQAVQVGQNVPPFNIRTAAGHNLTLQQCKGKPTLLVFLKPGTSLTKTLTMELPVWQQRLGSSTFHCLLLAISDDAAALPALQPTTNALLERAAGRTLASAFGITTTPHLVLLSPSGTLLASHEGWGPEVRASFDKLMREQTSKPSK